MTRAEWEAIGREAGWVLLPGAAERQAKEAALWRQLQSLRDELLMREAEASAALAGDLTEAEADAAIAQFKAALAGDVCLVSGLEQAEE